MPGGSCHLPRLLGGGDVRDNALVPERRECVHHGTGGLGGGLHTLTAHPAPAAPAQAKGPISGGDCGRLPLSESSLRIQVSYGQSA